MLIEIWIVSLGGDNKIETNIIFFSKWSCLRCNVISRPEDMKSPPSILPYIDSFFSTWSPNLKPLFRVKWHSKRRRKNRGNWGKIWWRKIDTQFAFFSHPPQVWKSKECSRLPEIKENTKIGFRCFKYRKWLDMLLNLVTLST